MGVVWERGSGSGRCVPSWDPEACWMTCAFPGVYLLVCACEQAVLECTILN